MGSFKLWYLMWSTPATVNLFKSLGGEGGRIDWNLLVMCAIACACGVVYQISDQNAKGEDRIPRKKIYLIVSTLPIIGILSYTIGEYFDEFFATIVVAVVASSMSVTIIDKLKSILLRFMDMVPNIIKDLILGSKSDKK